MVRQMAVLYEIVLHKSHWDCKVCLYCSGPVCYSRKWFVRWLSFLYFVSHKLHWDCKVCLLLWTSVLLVHMVRQVTVLYAFLIWVISSVQFISESLIIHRENVHPSFGWYLVEWKARVFIVLTTCRQLCNDERSWCLPLCAAWHFTLCQKFCHFSNIYICLSSLHFSIKI